MKDICVYTCITGNYDNLNEIKNPEKNIDYFCFTNNPNLTSTTWKVIQIQDNTLDNIRLARKIKILGHDRIKNYKIAVWTDADIIWQKSISDFVETYLRDAPFAISNTTLAIVFTMNLLPVSKWPRIQKYPS